jgi:hypothetical protein
MRDRLRKSAVAPICAPTRGKHSPALRVETHHHQPEISMRRIILATMFLGVAVAAHAADDKDKKPAGTAKGAAVGALAGHEVGSGHAVAGAATGAAIGHHQTKKNEQTKSQ